MTYITLFITVPLTVFAVLFAVANTQDVTVHSALPAFSVDVPLYLLGLSLLGGGFFLGALFVWLHSGKMLFRCWRETRRAAQTEKKYAALAKKQDAPHEAR